MEEKIEMWQLQQRLGLPLNIKEQMSLNRIKKYYDMWDGEIYVAFSGGKDSTVLLNMVRSIYKEVPGVFIDSGMEFPEIREFVKTIPNVIWIKPKLNFIEVINKYGYPVISKEVALKIYEIRNTKSDKLKRRRLYGGEKGYGKLSKKWSYLMDAPFKISEKCCDVMKINTSKKFEKESGKKCVLGLMVGESRQRMFMYLRYGCMIIKNRPRLMPLAFWTENDIWEYIKKYNINYCKIYDMGYKRTGCMFCMFGVHLNEKENKFTLMKKTHPEIYRYCMDNLGCRKVLEYIGVENY